MPRSDLSVRSVPDRHLLEPRHRRRRCCLQERLVDLVRAGGYIRLKGQILEGVFRATRRMNVDVEDQAAVRLPLLRTPNSRARNSSASGGSVSCSGTVGSTSAGSDALDLHTEQYCPLRSMVRYIYSVRERVDAKKHLASLFKGASLSSA